MTDWLLANWGWIVVGALVLWVLNGARKFNDIRRNTDETEYMK